MNTMTYKLCKAKIDRGSYASQEEMQLMLDVFYAGERITTDEYQELTALLNSLHKEPETAPTE